MWPSQTKGRRVQLSWCNGSFSCCFSAGALALVSTIQQGLEDSSCTLLKLVSLHCLNLGAPGWRGVLILPWLRFTAVPWHLWGWDGDSQEEATRGFFWQETERGVMGPQQENKGREQLCWDLLTSGAWRHPYPRSLPGIVSP